MVERPVFTDAEAFDRWKVEAQVDEDTLSGYRDYIEEQKQLKLPVATFYEWLLDYFTQYV